MEKTVTVQFLQTKILSIDQKKADIPLEWIITLYVQNADFWTAEESYLTVNAKMFPKIKSVIWIIRYPIKDNKIIILCLNHGLRSLVKH